MSENVPGPRSVRDEMERIYTEMSPAEIPWNIESPPGQMVDLMESGQVRGKGTEGAFRAVFPSADDGDGRGGRQSGVEYDERRFDGKEVELG